MVTARLEVMTEPDLELWRESRRAAGEGFPDVDDPRHDRFEALEVLVDDVAVGGAVVTYTSDGGHGRAAVRLLQTTVPPEARPVWAAVLAAVEDRVRAAGASAVTTAVAPALAAAFQAAGYRATMTTASKRLDPDHPTELQEDRRVSVRPMTRDERIGFVADATEFVRAGMDRAGLVSTPGLPLTEVAERLDRLLADPPPPEELLLTGLVDGEPVGRAWGTLVPDGDAVDLLGNTIDLFPRFRGQGLTTSFIGAVRRHVVDVGVRDVHLRTYGYDRAARRTLLGQGAGLEDVHLRKDLT